MGFYIMGIVRHSSGRCSYRKGIPEKLRPFCKGKWEFKVSLGEEGAPGFHTRLEQAIQACEDLLAKAQKQLEGAYDSLDGPRIAYLTEMFRAQSLEQDNAARYSPDERELYLQVRAELETRGLAEAVNWSGPSVRRWADKTRETVHGMLHIYRDLRAIGDLDGMLKLWDEEANELIDAAGLVVDPTADEAMRQLCRSLNDAAISVCQDKLKRLDGEEVPTPPEPTKAIGSRSKASKVSLRDIFELYAVSKPLKPNVRDEWRGYIERLIEFVGHDDATLLTEEQILDWRDMLLSSPNRRGKLRQPVTVRDKYITSVRATLRWAVRHRHLRSNVAAEVYVDVPKKAKLRERDFTNEEARAILSATLIPASPRILPCYRRARRWIPWLCAYTGGRVNEFSQMRGDDVFQLDGSWVIRITPEAGSVKTNEARIVPIHEHLIAQGFLAMVKEQGTGPLFYDPERTKITRDSNRYIKKVGEKIAKWVRKDVGITDPNVMPNHGWRHTFKSLTYLAGIEERMADALQGHAPLTTGRGYGTPPLQARVEAMAKIPRFEI